MNLDARVSNQNNFFCILERVDGVNGEISKNPNHQCTSELIQTEQLTVLAFARTTKVKNKNEITMWPPWTSVGALVKASKNKANPTTDEVREENQAAVLTQSQCSSPQSMQLQFFYL